MNLLDCTSTREYYNCREPTKLNPCIHNISNYRLQDTFCGYAGFSGHGVLGFSGRSKSVIDTCVLPVLFYGCENWILSKFTYGEPNSHNYRHSGTSQNNASKLLAKAVATKLLFHFTTLLHQILPHPRDHCIEVRRLITTNFVSNRVYTKTPSLSIHFTAAQNTKSSEQRRESMVFRKRTC
jgi:hypothetical protein